MATYVYVDGKYEFEFEDGSVSPASFGSYSQFVNNCKASIKEDRDNNKAERLELLGKNK